MKNCKVSRMTIGENNTIRQINRLTRKIAIGWKVKSAKFYILHEQVLELELRQPKSGVDKDAKGLGYCMERRRCHD